MALTNRFFDDIFEPFSDFPLLSDIATRRRGQEAGNVNRGGEVGSFLGGHVGTMMRMDVSESPEQYMVKVDMPGFNKQGKE